MELRCSSSILSVPLLHHGFLPWRRGVRAEALGELTENVLRRKDHLEVSTMSSGGVCSVMIFFLVGKLRRMTDVGGRRCSVEKTILRMHFILSWGAQWAIVEWDWSIAPVIQWRVTPFDCCLLRSPNECYGSPVWWRPLLLAQERWWGQRAQSQGGTCGFRWWHFMMTVLEE
jgi:hypothetical protein